MQRGPAWAKLCLLFIAPCSKCKGALHPTQPLSVDAFGLTGKAGLCEELRPSKSKAPMCTAARTKLDWPANRCALTQVAMCRCWHAD